ncbi:AH receptor-interacting protein-like [Anopheles albimanus]|uniref:AIP/AIPL N-terminal FKBP-type PPIase domain-containing protein n=1 Tax=Anopheles albimanus TaxID=7167 RepID=A0A182FMK9_ANOAL|nr:AH receptor-interacting protein-like [Anopheles albimanus]
MDSDLDEAKIIKTIIHTGSRVVPFRDGTKVTFHFQTHKCDGSLIDDSRKYRQKPMELVLGKKFKLEVWEAIVQQMAVGEVARFRCDKSLVLQYPFVAKTIRDAAKPREERKHCCGMTVQNEGIGYRDLDELFAQPQDLEFTIELLSVESPGEYEQESWQLSDEEKLQRVSRLREQGNTAYGLQQYAAALAAYSNAIGIVEQLMLKEKPDEPEWVELARLKVPLLLNYSQCRLLERDYYAVIEHCTEVLRYEPDCVKALFRRGKAHAGAWNLDRARADFERCSGLDPTLTVAIGRELAKLAEQARLRDVEDRIKYQKLF